MRMERDFTWGDKCTMQCAGDVLSSCTLETGMVLLTDVTPINSIKTREKLRKCTIYNYIKKNKISRNKFNQVGERLLH